MTEVHFMKGKKGKSEYPCRPGGLSGANKLNTPKATYTPGSGPEGQFQGGGKKKAK